MTLPKVPKLPRLPKLKPEALANPRDLFFEENNPMNFGNLGNAG